MRLRALDVEERRERRAGHNSDLMRDAVFASSFRGEVTVSKMGILIDVVVSKLIFVRLKDYI